jgi:two-component system phosphate regulon sensor histidine kinase PhoR
MHIHLGSEPLHVLGDTEAFHQIFDNLIDNAIKYTESGGSVDVTVAREGSRVRVDVKDTGVGIPQEDVPRIFERFYRVDKARSRELGGTGLGLSIVKHLVQALEGEIQVESKVDEGSTFRVLFQES